MWGGAGGRHLTQKEETPIQKQAPGARPSGWETGVPVTEAGDGWPCVPLPTRPAPMSAGPAMFTASPAVSQDPGPAGRELVLQLPVTPGCSEIPWACGTTKSSQLKEKSKQEAQKGSQI